MKRLGIYKPKDGMPSFEWLDEERNGRVTFSPEALNFNTFIRPFSKNNLQRQYLESKICKYYLIENGDVRLCEKRSNILNDEGALINKVSRVQRFARNIMSSII